MSLEDKAGQLFHSQIGMGPAGALADANPHFNLLGVVDDPRLVASWHNRLQDLAASTPLGIPITLSTDPRHHFTDNPGTAFNARAVSQWPEPLGLAALRSAELVARFADIARQEYLALGFRLALHPQVDLATEPRWSRIAATFGEDADLTSELAVASEPLAQRPGDHRLADRTRLRGTRQCALQQVDPIRSAVADHGSAAFGNVARAVLGFARDTEVEDGSCVISHAKNNLCRLDLPSLRYCIESVTIDTEEGPA